MATSKNGRSAQLPTVELKPADHPSLYLGAQLDRFVDELTTMRDIDLSWLPAHVSLNRQQCDAYLETYVELPIASRRFGQIRALRTVRLRGTQVRFFLCSFRNSEREADYLVVDIGTRLPGTLHRRHLTVRANSSVFERSVDSPSPTTVAELRQPRTSKREAATTPSQNHPHGTVHGREFWQHNHKAYHSAARRRERH